jgi:hypothetical protein
MFYKFILNLKLIQNNEILPNTIEDNIIFYELVIKNGPDVILRIPFLNEEKWKLEMYDTETVINTNRTVFSVFPNIVRFDRTKNITFHAVKVSRDLDSEEGPLIKRIGYETHIKESTSDIQDIAFFEMNPSAPPPASVPVYMEDFKLFKDVEKFKPVVEVPLHNRTFNTQYWLTQRTFYSSSHTTLSNNVHRENIELIGVFCEKYKKYVFRDILELMILFAKVVTGGRIKYKVDKKFAEYSLTTDAGNVEIETSTRGDCEDMGHFYMRIFRTLIGVYKYFISDENSNIFSHCKVLEENYIPFNFICQVKLERGLEFHSTLIFIPVTVKSQTISFEVTNPKKSYILPNKEYFKWHNENYFLVDNYFLTRVTDVHLDKISVHDLKFINY